MKNKVFNRFMTLCTMTAILAGTFGGAPELDAQAKARSASATAVGVASLLDVASSITEQPVAADPEADPDEYVTGAGAELVIGSVDSMTKQDFLDMMEDLTIARNAETLANWGYTNLGIADVTESLNIRREASEDSEKVGELPTNAACEILDESNGWAHIISGRVEGYVKMQYLLTGDAAIARGTETQILTATVMAQNLKIRKAPDTDHGTWAMIGNGKILQVAETLDNGWVSVVYGEGTDAAYVSADYVNVGYTLDTALNMTEVKYGKGVTDAGVDLAEQAIQYVGHPYVYGGVSLSNGTDCSGFTMLLYAKYGISLSHSARAQSNCGTEVSLSELQPGDLVFYADGTGINHVAVYIGGGQVCHASNPRSGIIISSMYYRTPVRARRLL